MEGEEDCQGLEALSLDGLGADRRDDLRGRFLALSEPARVLLRDLIAQPVVTWSPGRTPRGLLEELIAQGFIGAWSHGGQTHLVLTWDAADAFGREVDREGGFSEPFESKRVYVSLAPPETPVQHLAKLIAGEDKRRRETRLKGGVGR